MKATFTANCASVISLLEQGYSDRDIERRTGLGKSTVGRIKKHVDTDKENNPGGRPSKFSARDKTSIIRQIQSGKLDNAVQATHFINSTIPHPVHPQTVRRALQESGFHSATKKKVPMLKKTHCQRRLEFAQRHGNWTVADWKRVLWTDETKINRIGSDGKVYVWKQRGKSISDRTTSPTVKHGGGNCQGSIGQKTVEFQDEDVSPHRQSYIHERGGYVTSNTIRGCMVATEVQV